MVEFANCSDCASLDGVYIMEPMQQINIGGEPANCSGALLLPTICGDSDEPGCYGLIGLRFYQAGGAFHLLVNLQSGGTPCGHGGQPSIEWETDFAPAPPTASSLTSSVSRGRGRSPGSPTAYRRRSAVTVAERRA